MTNRIILALDVSREEALKLIERLEPVENLLAGYKVGSLLVINHGKEIITEIKGETDLPIIFDLQKMGTDIPEIVLKQVESFADVGVNQLIVCPMGAGNETLLAFTMGCFETRVVPVCVVEMTHPGANRYLVANSADLILQDALDSGIRNFIYPATKPTVLKSHFSVLREIRGVTIKVAEFKRQGGDPKILRELGVSEFIVGGAIYGAEDPVSEVRELFKEINKDIC